jgi:hypothetical protein
LFTPHSFPSPTHPQFQGIIYFANSRLQHNPAYQQRKGNARADVHHSSILRRIGPTFYDTCFSLIGALLQRHADRDPIEDQVDEVGRDATVVFKHYPAEDRLKTDI